MRMRAIDPGKWAIVAIAILAPVFYAGCTHDLASAPPPSPPEVKVATVGEKDVTIYGTWTGTLDGYLNAKISPQVNGYLIRQDYNEGRLVHKDQVLFEIDPRPFQAALDLARAQMAQAQAQLAKATLDVNRDIPEAQARAIPQSQLDDDRQTQLAGEAAVEAAKASVEQASLNLGYTKVRSLVSGIAGVAAVQVGNLVGPSTVLTSVSQVNPIKAYFPISTAEYLGMAGRGSPGTVNLLSQADPIPLQLILSRGLAYRYKGRILFANRQVDSQTGTIQIVGEFPNPASVLRPGETAQVHAMTNIEKSAVVVPQRAVSELQGGYEVAVVGAGNKITIRTVQVGEQVGTEWVITKGLQAGDRIVAEGTQEVHDGMVVNPKPYIPAKAN